MVFVPATPGSTLKRALNEDIKKSGLKIKVVEKTGVIMKRILQRSDPFKTRFCSRENCISTGGKGPCDGR